MDKIKNNKNLQRIISFMLCIALLITSIQVSNLVNKDILGLNENEAKIESEESKEDVIIVDSIDELISEISDDSVIEESDKTITNTISFMTKRLIVLSDKEFTHNATSIVQFDNMYILSYDSEENCKSDYELLLEDNTITSVEVDSIMEVEEDEDVTDDADFYEDFDASYVTTDLKKYLDNIEAVKDIKVAILDTGINKENFDNDRIIDLGLNLSTSGEKDSIKDDNGHGTTIATIISNNYNNKVKLVPIKIANSDGKATVLNTYLGIQKAIENNVDIINISMNTYKSNTSQILNDIIDEANEKGILVVVSAGNNNTNVENITPANIDSAIVVSAIEEDNSFSSYSNHGKGVDYSSYGNFDGKNGTSFAAATVTSVLADALSKGCDSSILDKYAVDLGEKGKDSYYGNGLIAYYQSLDNNETLGTPEDKPSEIPEDADTDNLYTSSTKTYGTDAFEVSNGYLRVSQGTIKSATKSGTTVTGDNRFARYYYSAGESNFNTFSDYSNDYFYYEVNNGYVYNGKKRNCNVKMEYADKGDGDIACGFQEESANTGNPSGITGAKDSKIKVTISGLDPDFQGILEFTDLDKNEGWEIANAYTASNNVWVKNARTMHLNITTSSSGIKVIGTDESPTGDSVNCGDTSGNKHIAYVHVKANSSGTIVMYYYTGTTRHASQIKGVDGAKVVYHKNGHTVDDDDMPDTDHSAALAKYKIPNLVPTTTGYTFKGWNTKANGTGTSYNKGETIDSLPDGTTDLYAQWKVNQYTVTYIDRISGTNTQLGSTTKSKNYGSTVAGSDLGTDTSDNKYYNGYKYSSCTSATVGTSGATVYRDFVLVTTTKTATINWVDFNNGYKSRPDSVVLRVKNGSTEVTNATVLASAFTTGNTWTYTFTLQKYNTSNGTEISYSVSEDTPASKNKALKYSVGVSGWTITNTAKRDITDPTYGAEVKGSITWDDNNNSHNWRPTNITITLYKDGTATSNTKTVSNTTTSYSFTGLDVLNELGQPHVYSVVVTPIQFTTSTSRVVTLYSHTYDGPTTSHQVIGTFYKTVYTINITNTFTPPKFKITLNENIDSRYDTGKVNGTSLYWEYFSKGNYTSEDCTTGITYITKPSRIGFTFKGYYKSVTGKDTTNIIDSYKNPTGDTQYIDETGKIVASNTTFRDDTTIYAMWQRNKYTVTYNYSENGGYGVDKSSEDVVYYENPIDLSVIAYKSGDTGLYSESNSDGWRFIGWNTDKDATTALTSMDMPAENVTLYAIYEKKVTVKEFQIKGNVFRIATSSYKIYNKNTTATHILNATPDKCTVDDLSESEWSAIGWTTDTSGKSNLKELGATITPNQDITYYAVYERDFDVNFVDMTGIKQTTTTLKDKQYLNSYSTSNFVTPSFTTPNAHEFTYNLTNGAWLFKGWTKEIKNTVAASSLVAANETITNDKNHVHYYALYGRDLTASFVDYKGTTKTTTPITAPQRANAYDASDVFSTTITIPNINTYTGWRAIDWANASNSLDIALIQGNELTVVNNATYYALYEKEVYANFYKAGKTDPETLYDTQTANAGDIDGTKTYVTLTSPFVGSYKDSNNVNWSGKYWSLGKTKDSSNDLDADTEFSIKDDVDYYGMYQANYKAIFISMNNSTSSKQTISAPVYANANNMSDITDGKVTAPALKVCNYNSVSWTALGWTDNTTGNTADISVGDEVAVPYNNMTFYGIYSSAFTATFIDYVGSEKRTQTVDVGSVINSYNPAPVVTEANSPAIGIYNDGEEDWIIKGWSSSQNVHDAIDFESEDKFTINENTTYYAVYKRDVVLSVVDFLANASHTSQLREEILTNSYNIKNTSLAKFTIPAQEGYMLNDKIYQPKGWSLSPIHTSLADVKYNSNEEITINNNLTIYAMYSRNITISYNGNGGTNPPSDTGEIVVNASNATANPVIKITETIPKRTSLVFANKWLTGIKSGTEYLSGQSYTFTDDTTLYAQWTLATVDMKATINWIDNENVMNSRPEFIRLSVYRNGNKISSYIVSTIDDTISSPITNVTIPSDGLRVYVSKTGTTTEYTFAGLQKYDSETGTAYNYTLVQEPFKSINKEVDYETTYSADTWTIDNTMVNSNNKTISGTIYWYDSSNAWHLRPGEVTLTLLKTDPDTKTTTKKTQSVKVDVTNSLEYKFEKQVAVNAKNNPYVYEVVLSDITLYSTKTIKQNDNVFDFECSLTNMPGGFTGGAGNHLTIAADAFNWKGATAKADDYFATATNEDMSVLVTLKTIYKTWEGEGENKHDVWKDNNKYLTDTDGNIVEYNVIVTPNKNTQVDYLPDGKYELVVHDSILFDFDKFAASEHELDNATVTKEDGRYFITFEAKPDSSSILNLHTHVILKGWRGYTSIKEYMYQPVHVFGDELIYGDPASCEENGFKYHVCILCGARSSQGEIVPAYGHTFVNGICQECGAVQK